MKMIKILLIIVPSIFACQTENQSNVPFVNSVADVSSLTGTAIPLTNEKIFLVNGKISGNAYVAGYGVVELQDLENTEKSIYFTTNSTYKVGQVVTLKLSKIELLKINDESLSTLYCEK